MRLAVLFHRFGPYHLARLQAAGRRCNIYGIETSGTSTKYAWEQVTGSTSFEHVTVYPEGDIHDLPPSEVSARVERVLRKIRPDVVAIHGWAFPDALAATAWSGRTGTPSVIMSASTAQDFERSWWKEAVKRQIVQTHQAGLVGGERHVTYLTELGMPEAHISVGYDVVDNDHFAQGAADALHQATAQRHRLGLPKHYFLTVCRFVEKKNLDRLLEAYARYHDYSQDPWDLVLLGDGPLKYQLINRRGELGLGDHVHFPGFKQYKELPSYYGLADAFVLPSITEQWGLVVNEAMAAGLPVLVSERCGCTPELVQNGSNGFTFDPESTTELSDHMVYITSRQCDREPMAACSKEIISNWTPESFADGLVEAARRALAANTSWSVLGSGVAEFLLRTSQIREGQTSHG